MDLNSSTRDPSLDLYFNNSIYLNSLTPEPSLDLYSNKSIYLNSSTPDPSLDLYSNNSVYLNSLTPDPSLDLYSNNSIYLNSSTPDPSLDLYSNNSIYLNSSTPDPSLDLYSFSFYLSPNPFNSTLNHSDDFTSSTPHPPSPSPDLIPHLILFYCPFLILFGTIGNILSILVFSRPKMRHSSMSIYSRFMALNDLAALYNGPVYYYLLYCHNFDINTTYFVCKTHNFRVYIFTDSSAYTIVSLTTERLLSVLLPHKVRLLCSKGVSYYVLIAIFLLLCVANSPLIVWTDIVTSFDNETGTNITSCVFQPPPYAEEYWYAFDLTKFVVIPVGFISISNIVLLLQLYGGGQCTCMMFWRKDKADQEKAEISRKVNSRNQRSVTVTLICVSVVFFVCNMPVVLFPVNLVSLERPEHQLLASIVSQLLMFTNNSLNFVLYCACGTRFRNELMDMLCFRANSAIRKTSSGSS